MPPTEKNDNSGNSGKLAAENKKLRRRITELELATVHAGQEADLPGSESSAMLDNLVEYVVYTDLAMKVRWVNRPVCNYLGLSRAEIIGRLCFDLWHKRTDPCPECAVRQAMESGHPTSVEKKTPDGRSWLVRGYPHFDEQGRRSGGIEVTLEITQRRQVEKALETEQAYLTQFLENSPEAVVLLSNDSHVLRVNNTFTSLFGYNQNEVRGRSIDDLIAPPKLREEADQLTRQAARGEYFYRESIRRRKDGFPVDVAITGAPIVINDKQVAFYGLYRDIGERRRKERLLETLNRASLAMESALSHDEIFQAVAEEFRGLGFQCMVFTSDEKQTTLRLGNSSYPASLLTAAEKILGLKQESFSIPLDSASPFREVILRGRTIHTAEPGVLIQSLLPRKLKKFAPHLMKLFNAPCSISAPLLEEERIVGLLSVQSNTLGPEDIPAITAFAHQLSANWRKARLMQDLEKSLSEMKAMQAQLLQAQKMEAVGRLAGGVAHDFNNLLTVITGYSALLRENLEAENPLQEEVREIEQAAQKAALLTRQLLAFSRKQILNPKVFDLNHVVADIRDMLKRLIGEDIELTTELADDLWLVEADPGQIEQVIMNLAVNARDAMPGGGKLTAATRNFQPGSDFLARHPEVSPGNYVRLSIVDTGAGIAPRALPHLFEPFFTTKERGKGTGLGLSTVYGIVKQSHGYIYVESEPGQGAAFSIYLPKSEASTQQSEPEQEAKPGLTGDETILLVEDEETVRSYTRTVLERQGYKVLDAGEGPEALRLATGNSGGIDLLITDVVMPRMSGSVLAERIREMIPDLTVIFLSGYAEDNVVHQGVLDDNINFLAKPFNKNDLLKKIRAALDR
jgi:two-component system cell cycle sensor histidine kinase/response regulator CckA